MALGMTGDVGHGALHGRLIDSLYVESMLLADEARSYFDHVGKTERDRLSPLGRVGFSCESLKVTTRLMHVIAWLLTQRAVLAGELTLAESQHRSRRLGEAPVTDPEAVAPLPPVAQALIDASIELYRRVARLEETQLSGETVASPARKMLDRLSEAF